MDSYHTYDSLSFTIISIKRNCFYILTDHTFSSLSKTLDSLSRSEHYYKKISFLSKAHWLWVPNIDLPKITKNTHAQWWGAPILSGKCNIFHFYLLLFSIQHLKLKPTMIWYCKRKEIKPTHSEKMQPIPNTLFSFFTFLSRPTHKTL